MRYELVFFLKTGTSIFTEYFFNFIFDNINDDFFHYLTTADLHSWVSNKIEKHLST